MPLSDHELESIRETMSRTNERLATVEADIRNLVEAVKTLSELIVKTYVTRSEFKPTQLITYGIVVGIGGAAMTKLASLLIH